MNEVKLYECEVCRTRYADKTKAEKCERTHKTPKTVKNSKCHPFTVMRDGYPESVEVTFDDNSTRIYKRG